MSLEIITTADGSPSLLNTELQETYHSIHGALQESIHVFIQHGLQFFIEQHPSPAVRIFEVGFGTGLNALLTLSWASKNNCAVHYTTLEAFPLPEEIWSKLNYPNPAGEKINFTQLHQAEWSAEKNITSNFALLKICNELQRVSLDDASVDIIYFDAFAPRKQPEMWNISCLQKVAAAMKPNGVLVTYCAKGQVKRDLREIGLQVETLPGPPGKKEMVRAVKLSR